MRAAESTDETPRSRDGRRRSSIAALTALAILVAAERSDATCNVIPTASQVFIGTRGSLDRPFSSPYELVTVRDSQLCHEKVRYPADAVVSLVFKPPEGDVHFVAISRNCSQVVGCPTTPHAAFTCVPSSDLTIVGDGIQAPAALRFRFPDTRQLDEALPADLELTGPTTIALSAPDALPCTLATDSCANQVALAGASVLACVDALFTNDGEACPSTPHDAFPGFTALPAPNDYQALVDETGDLRFTVDALGNLLMPMDWTSVLVRPDQVPVPNLLHGRASIEAFAGSRQPLRIPSRAFLGSYDPDGVKIAPIFDPQLGRRGADDETLVFGSADTERSVLRIARRSPAALACVDAATSRGRCTSDADCESDETCGLRTCRGGLNAGERCITDSACPAGRCVDGHFDFGSRLIAGVGPIVVRNDACLGGLTPLRSCDDDRDCACGDDTTCTPGQCAELVAHAEYPTPFDGLNQTETLNAFVVNEAIDGIDRNGDGETSASVILMQDRTTGLTKDLGTAGCAPLNRGHGRAVSRIKVPPFSYPALALKDDLLVFLEPESLQVTSCDQNGDHDGADSLLRVLRLGNRATEPVDVLKGRKPPSIDPEPLVNGRSIVISQEKMPPARELVFTRIRAPARATAATSRVSAAPDGSAPDGNSWHPALSGDGRYVAFASDATNLVDPPTDGTRQVFVRDRNPRDDGTLDLPERVTTTMISVNADGEAGDARSDVPAVSGDGRYVAFASAATNLTSDDADAFCERTVFGIPGGCSDILVYDREAVDPARRLVRVSVSAEGEPGNGDSFAPAISASGRFVAFESNASNFDPRTTEISIFLHDRDADADGVFDEAGAITTEQLSGPFWSREASISPDGHLVGYREMRTSQVAVYDRRTGETTTVSVTSKGVVSNGLNYHAAVSDSGLVAFASVLSTNLDHSGGTFSHVYLRDLDRGTTERVSTRAGAAHSGPAVSISGNGRYVAFNLNGVVVQDRVTGMVGRVTDPDRGLVGYTMAADGRTVAFVTDGRAAASDRDDHYDVFVHAIDFGDADVPPPDHGHAGTGLLQVRDVTTGSAGSVVGAQCPATQVAVADGRAAFLRPESVGPARATCATARDDLAPFSLNDDGDDEDAVVQLWTGGAVENLGEAARQVAIGTHFVAAITDSEAGPAIVKVHAIGTPARDWTSTGQTAATVDVCGDAVVFLTPVPGSDEMVLQIYDPNGSTLVNTGQTAKEFVCSARLVAFRTGERSAGGSRDLNGDTDTDDDVLQIHALDDTCLAPTPPAGCLVNTRLAVTPCTLEACDPRRPYRVGENTVSFLTHESDQRGPASVPGPDLDGDLDGPGYWSELVVQEFNFRQAASAVAQPLGRAASGVARQQTALANGIPARGVSYVLGALRAGVCARTGTPCAEDDDCKSDACILPTRRCVQTLATACTLPDRDPDPAATPQPGPPPGSECAQGDVCSLAEKCEHIGKACANDADCGTAGSCRDIAGAIHDPADPLAVPNGGGRAFTSAGHCVETQCRKSRCASDADCPVGTCTTTGCCEHVTTSCGSDADCPSDPVRMTQRSCRQDLTVVTATDSDLDEVPDLFDNCASVPNADQLDDDQDGVGNACAAASLCGNGTRDFGELCDDGNRDDGDACSGTCHLCGATPRRDCQSRLPGESRLTITRSASGRANLRWQLPDANVRSRADFGDPLRSTTYAFCIYDGAHPSGALLAATAPAGSDRRAGHWAAAGERGFSYADRRPDPGKLARVDLTVRANGPGRLVVESEHASVPALPLTPAVTVQLVNDVPGRCWQADFAVASENAPRSFRATHVVRK